MITMIKDIMNANDSATPNSREMAVLKENFPSCFKADGSFDIERFKEFLSDKQHTFLLVTHAPDIAKEFCKRGILIENSQIKFDGNIQDCIDLYLK